MRQRVDEGAVVGERDDGRSSSATFKLNWRGCCEKRQSDGGEDGGEEHFEGVRCLSLFVFWCQVKSIVVVDGM